MIPFLLAQAAPAAPSSPLGNPMIMMVLMLVMMYFLLIRPQRQRQKQQDTMQSSLKVGDQVVTIGGAHGIISSVKEKTIMVKVADNVKIEFDKSAVASVAKKAAEPAESATPAA
ncbi:MAG: preprotein translocase subunit YajC [Verrucomicrobiaceae bacterium]|nr:preprotein translocase subunit YajC [Verrucomicrobiaceae bacterium]